MIVKICGITNLEDAQAAASLGAHALGFNFYPPSPRYLTPAAAARITEKLPAEIWKVGVFVNLPSEQVAEIVREAGLDIAQLHGDEPAERLPAGIRVWKALPVGESFALEMLEAYPVEAFLLDSPSDGLYGGTGRSFDWTRVRGTGKRIVLAGGLDAANVRRAIGAARPWGVDACSRLESSPGRKDYGKMEAFVKAALEEPA